MVRDAEPCSCRASTGLTPCTAGDPAFLEEFHIAPRKHAARPTRPVLAVGVLRSPDPRPNGPCETDRVCTEEPGIRRPGRLAVARAQERVITANSFCSEDRRLRRGQHITFRVNRTGRMPVLPMWRNNRTRSTPAPRRESHVRLIQPIRPTRPTRPARPSSVARAGAFGPRAVQPRRRDRGHDALVPQVRLSLPRRVRHGRRAGRRGGSAICTCRRWARSSARWRALS